MRSEFIKKFGLLVFLIIFNISGAVVFGQKTVGNNSLTAKSAADIDGWKKYASPKGDMQVAFPGVPEKESEPMNTGAFKTELVTYTAQTDLQLFMFGFVDFKINFDDQATINGFYDSWQSGLQENLLESTVKQEDITFKGKTARKVEIKNAVLKVDAIGLFANGKMFQLVVFSPTDETDEDAPNRQRLVKKFFDSFAFGQTGTSGIGDTNVGTGGKGNVYKNASLKFSLTLPEGWTEISKDDSDVIKENVRENTRAKTKAGNATLNRSLNNTKILFNYLYTGGGVENVASFIAGTETNPNPPRATMRQIAEVSQRTFVKELGYQAIAPIKNETVGGAVFQVLHLKKINDADELLFQKVYMRKIGSQILSFALTYKSVDELKVMEDSMKTLKFTR